MQEVCKYYIEISRYRDACGFIREGMDLTQLHFSTRRISLFLLYQVNADLVASCTQEAASRIKIVEHLINSNGEKLVLNKKSKLIANNDLYNLRNYVYLNFLIIYKEIKLDRDITEDIQDSFEETLLKRIDVIRSSLETNRQLNDYCKDILVDIYFLVYNYFKQKSSEKHKPNMVQILKWIKIILLKAKEAKSLTTLQEKWHLAEYHCCVFELNELEGKDHLKKANDYIKNNPHPSLYRRICFNLFNVESNSNKKVMHLLETQSIALRHKACAIQIKQKRKSSIEMSVFEKLTNSLSFKGDVNTEYLSNFINHILPSNSVVVALVLNSVNDLFVIRLERENEPFLYQVKYDLKYNENFKQIMLENDLSMKQSDRTKYWTTRTSLNKRLNAFLEELESEVFSDVAKSLLLGSYLDHDMNVLIRSFKKDLRIVSLTESQEKLIKIIFLGIEHLTVEELSKALKREFSENQVEKYLPYLLDKKTEMVSAKRKHVCLLIDKVVRFLIKGQC